ncbi:GNAT family N-acetyltransferase [Ralstonia solanacearum]|nr:GNAT family N-acetyltransferase [Ralstonia solanacearum]CBJ49525.1 hypothethical protein, Acyl-CoA N-acyltransferases domain [Ralstonia solanacearum PSI07]
MHVHRDWRGKGAGSRLMEALRSASTG